ncbi:DUF3822 family protein [Pedobacter montanisoli]|uniref:DUF3822 family protein n=1 Tax=Pedobacter montanisoli TaxID=2923277 RepID=A0ABS9ZX46_9SPHI|nr:DUF3822 family protein [Pedobacter montanisoli]MCJ0742896.1 DUF3822 family protein [Pedobacter montanisoli]
MNENNSILLIDPNFHPETAASCSLIVKIGSGNLSYAIINNDEARVIALYDEPECTNSIQKFNQLLKTDTYLTLPYAKINVAVNTGNIAFIPNELFDEDEVNTYTQYFSEDSAKQVFLQPDHAAGFTTVFSLPLLTEKSISGVWSHYKVYQQNQGLIALAKNFEKQNLLLDFSANTFEALVFNDGILQFQQHYEFDNNEEFVYYLLLITQQLNLDFNQTSVSVSGIIHLNDEKWSSIKKYFTNLNFLNIDIPLNSYVIEDMPKHYYAGLLSIYTCG